MYRTDSLNKIVEYHDDLVSAWHILTCKNLIGDQVSKIVDHFSLSQILVSRLDIWVGADL